jgi:NAD(P)-dependent dehydrogenase (short-subunit alcohol dehydrogenase family)
MPLPAKYSISRRFGGKEEQKALEGFNDFHPIGKFGSADEVANAIVFLLSDKSAGQLALS